MKRVVSGPLGLGVAVLVAVWAIAVVVRAASPTGHFTVSGAGAVATVYDTKTLLTWQQTVPMSTYTQSDAVAYCSGLGTGWRLPTAKELMTLVDFTVPYPGPTIDATAFPNTPPSVFWSSTLVAGFGPFPGQPLPAWYVDFGSGSANYAVMSPTNAVRCVR